MMEIDWVIPESQPVQKTGYLTGAPAALACSFK